MRDVLVLVAVALTCACKGSVTEVFVCYSAEPPIVAGGGTLSAQALPFEGGRVLWAGELEAGSTQGFIQRDLSGVDVTLTATTSTGTIAQRARVRFVPDRVVDVSLRVESVCATVSCGPDETCAQGLCVPVELSPDCLPDHGSIGPASCDPRGRSGCTVVALDGG